MREIGRREAGESRNFPILWIGIIEMSSRRKERNAKTRKDWKCVGENPCQSEEGALV